MYTITLSSYRRTTVSSLLLSGLFSHFSDGSGHETDSFAAAFAIDGPPRKRYTNV